MAEFFKTTRVWVVDFRFDGKARQWMKPLDVHSEAAQVRQDMQRTLEDLYGGRATLTGVRPATAEEERQFLRGEQPKNAYCPLSRAPEARAGRMNMNMNEDGPSS